MSDEAAPGEETVFAAFLDDYFAECDEHLMGVRRLLLALEVSVGRAEVNVGVLDELFRHFHSLKGISGMVEVRPAEEVAHRLEGYLRVLRRGELTLTAGGLDMLFDGTQLLDQIVAARRTGDAPPRIETVLSHIDQLVSAVSPDESAETAPPAGSLAPTTPGRSHQRFTFVPSRLLVDRGVRVDTVRQRLAALGEIVEAAPRVTGEGTIAFDFVVATTAPVADVNTWAADGITVEPFTSSDPAASEPAPVEPLPPRDDGPAAASGRSHYVRVDLSRLDDLMRNVGDLVISRARLNETLARVAPRLPAAESRTIQENAVLIDRQLRTLREGIMRVRLVPVSEIFRRMPFVVRDLARETGKSVQLELQGQATEIDKFLIERMMDPVLHLVRNAVSHGLELPGERIAAGKRPEGLITLSASTIGEIVRLEIADDGRGIDPSAVVARAAAAGLDMPPGPPTDATLLTLICTPGLSTRDETDRVSGRGVGMAVVKSTVEELSGNLRLETAAGTGTRFIIELPITLAITDALIARVGTETFAVPQTAVREVIEVATDAIQPLEQNEIVPYRGGALPLVRLSRLFDLPEPDLTRLHVFVVGTGSAMLGIVVDRIVGQREIVVRATADPLVRVDGISGATDLGDGHVVLILDPAMLSRRTRERPVHPHAPASAAGRIRFRPARSL